MRAQHISYNNKHIKQPVSEPWSVCHPHQEDKELPSGSLLNIICYLLIYIFMHMNMYN